MLTQINYELQKANITSPTVKSDLYDSLAQTVLEAIDTVNNLGKDYVVLEDHPELKEEVGGMNLNFGKPVLFVQNRKKLTEARKFLETKDYYKNFDEEYKNDILSN